MFDSARAYVLDEIAVPADWKVVDEQRLPDTITRETVVVKHNRVEKLADAPLGHLSHEIILAVFIPNKDLAKAEARLDASVTEILASIDRHPTIKWTDAQKVVHPNGQYPGWEMTLTVITATPTKERS
ncbi:hypothetical protein [Leucobacter chironomi]|uniref:hypothetical protein n=1 Tax=Leucobacter chironomi TaxID=491918 RepID=UPI00040114AE|nr:hypothetical protein [Leucobacter chironomi]